MDPIKTIVGVGLSVLLAAATVACSPSSAASVPAATAAGSPSLGPSASVPVSGALPDLGLSNVQTDTTAARGARITAAGGTIVATGSNGTTYTLTIPEHALRETTEIGLYPVTSVANMPGSESLAAAAQFAPDGLVLVVPATLTIQLPPGFDSAGLGGVAWTGDGQNPHLYPTQLEGRTVTLTLFHFSGAGATPNALPLADPNVCRTSADLESQIQQDVTHPGPGMKAALTSHLKRCYRDLLAPALTTSIGVSQGGLVLDRVVSSWLNAGAVYSDWDIAIVNALAALAPQTLSDLPEIDEAKALAVSLDRAWFVAYNAKCLADYAADRADLDGPVQDASLAVDTAFYLADHWQLATRANELDLASLLSELCVKVVIDSTYSARNSGDVGTVAVKSGITIGGGPVSAYAMYLRIDAFGTAWDGDAEADGTFTTTVDWPNGLDPIQIMVVGTIVVTPRFDPPFRSTMTGSSRITRPAERLLFRFNSGLDSWSPGKAGPRGSSNWGSVSNEAGHIRLDGTGHPSKPNAWIFRTIHLPQNASTMTFDVSADDAPHADTAFRVRLVAADGTETDLKVGVARNVHPGHLDFRTLTVNIAQWKGQPVTFFFEQNDNGVNGVFTPPGQDEQLYYDNIRILRA